MHVKDICDPHAMHVKESELEEDLHAMSEADEALLHQLEDELLRKDEDMENEENQLEENVTALEELAKQFSHGSFSSSGILPLRDYSERAVWTKLKTLKN